MNSLTIDELRGLANTPSAKYTKELKERIRVTAQVYNVSLPTCQCKNKWFDAIMMLYRAMKRSMEASQTTTPTPQYNVRFISKTFGGARFAGRVFNANTDYSDIMWLKSANRPLFERLYREIVVSTPMVEKAPEIPVLESPESDNNTEE